MFRRRQTSSPNKRPLAVTVIAAALIVLFFVRLYNALMPLVDQGLFSTGLLNRPPSAFFAEGVLTDLGSVALTSLGYLLLVVGVILTLIGFLRLRRWSWLVLMLWTCISLAYALAQYFYGQPNYLVMASNMVIAFALSQSEIQHIFGIRAPAGEPLR
jgi:uncharacterized membrane protein YiaA